MVISLVVPPEFCKIEAPATLVIDCPPNCTVGVLAPLVSYSPPTQAINNLRFPVSAVYVGPGGDAQVPLAEFAEPNTGSFATYHGLASVNIVFPSLISSGPRSYKLGKTNGTE